MADVTHVHVSPFHAAILALRHAATGVWTFVEAVGKARGQQHLYMALSHKSDDELEMLGLKRDEIVHYVFSRAPSK